jgi:hypothetical protein
MNREPANIQYLCRCAVCDETFVSESKRNALYCPRKECRARAAEFESFYVLKSILGVARWAGAPTEAATRKTFMMS